MNNIDLQEGDQIVRYVRPTNIRKNGRADGSEFCLRSNRPDEISLSVNWLGAFDLEKSEQLDEVRRLSRLELKSNGRFAEMNVGKVLQIVADELDTLRELSLLKILRDPLEAEGKFCADPSHSGIYGLPPGNSEQSEFVGDLIAKCVTEMHLAKIHNDA